MDHLCELPTDKARARALDQLPRGLPETYERILSRVLESHKENQDLVANTLQWLVCAKVPLHSRALLDALAITPGDTHFDTDAMTSEDEILRWCSSLVRRRADGTGLELAHFTVKEYLLSIEPAKDAKFVLFRIQTGRSDLLLGHVCLTYLNLDDLGKFPPPNDIFDNMWSDSETDNENIYSEGYCDDDNGDGDGDGGKETEDEYDPNSDGDAARCVDDDVDHGINNEAEENHLDSEIREGDSGSTSSEGDQAEKRKKTAYTLFFPWLDKYPLLKYAALYWNIHLQEHLREPQVVNLTHKLFNPKKSNHFLWWSYAFLCTSKEEGWDQTFADCTPLHWAASLTLEEVCSWLIQEGSDASRISSFGSPLDCALLAENAIWWNEDPEDIEENLFSMDDEALNPSLMTSKATLVKLLIQAGAKVDENTDPDFEVLPLEKALIFDRHNSELMAHILEAGATVDEGALDVVDRYFRRTDNSQLRFNIPSGYSTLFAKVSYHDIPVSAREMFLKLSIQLHNCTSSVSKTLTCLISEDIIAEDGIEALTTSFFSSCRARSIRQYSDTDGSTAKGQLRKCRVNIDTRAFFGCDE
jgi:hypothetical protein